MQQKFLVRNKVQYKAECYPLSGTLLTYGKRDCNQDKAVCLAVQFCNA